MECQNDSDLSLERVVGRYEITREALKAYDEGKIDQWIEYIRPKTLEDWEEWHQNNPDNPFRDSVA